MSNEHFRAIVWLILGIVISALFTSCEKSSPLEDQKRWKSNFLAGETLVWIRRGTNDADLSAMQFTNKSGDARLFRYATNIVAGGASYNAVLKFECTDFVGKGYLVVARDGTVIWIGSDGKCEITYPRK